MEGSKGAIPPITLPVLLTAKKGGVTLPITLPMKLGSSKQGTVTLPITLPMSFVKGEEVRKSVKMPLKEKASLTSVKIPLSLTAWVFEGFIIDECIVDKMSSSLNLLEDIRSRILVDVELINRNKVKLKWYGDEVPVVEVYKKVIVDENYEFVSSHNWDEKETTVQIDNNEYEIKLEGARQTGVSGIVNIAETNYLDVFTDVNVLINEKVYSVEVDLTSKHTIEVNL